MGFDINKNTKFVKLVEIILGKENLANIHIFAT